jgi:hypothetical protein
MAASYNPWIIDPKFVPYIFDVGNIRSYPSSGSIMYNLNPANQFKTVVDVTGVSYVNEGVRSYFNLNNNVLEVRSANNTFFLGSESVSLWVYPINVDNLQIIYQLLGVINDIGTTIYISGGYIGAESHNSTPDGEETGYTLWYKKIEPNKWYNITLVGPQFVSSGTLNLYVNGVSAFSVGGGSGTGPGGQRDRFFIGGNIGGSRVYDFLTREQIILNSVFPFTGRFSKISYLTTNKITSENALDFYNKDKGRYINV